MKFKPTIGLEIHVELNTQSKMFCGCKNDPDETKANTNICPVCTAQPGVLPVINQRAVEKVIKTALALNCQIAKQTFFERKNYFYPDLPKGYQISQYVAPLSKNGYLKLSSGKHIGIERIHLEEDTGKLIHLEAKEHSLVDFNRAGIPLMELVTEPDIESAEQAKEFIKQLQLILKYLGVSQANMEKGQMRAEVNISLAPSSAKKLGTKVEIKNLNSIKAVEKGIGYEIKRQTELLEKAKKIIQETRGWRDKKEITFSQRAKEQAHDYRYFPEPDLPPLELTDKFLKEIKAKITELPQEKKQRFEKEYYLTDKEVALYLSQQDLGDYFEKVVSELKDWLKTKAPEMDSESNNCKRMVKLASNYIATDLQFLLKGSPLQEEKLKISPENFAEFLAMIFTGEISSKIAKMVLKEMFEKGSDPSQIIKSQKLEQITDDSAIEKIAKQVIAENPKPTEDYRQGKKTTLQFLVGKVMAQSKGRANPQKTAEILKKLL